jgi:small subunit ribosomal protein S4
MSRYTGPRVRVLRALGVDLPGLTSKKSDKRPYPPGQHGQARKKFSEFALRLREKQKLRMNYGVTEKQLRGLVVEAKSANDMATGGKLVELLERRLDNVVFRAGFGRTIPAARQLVNHGLILVDGKRVDIASYRIKAGQVISVRAKSQTLVVLDLGKDIAAAFQTPWLEVNPTEKRARVTSLPDEGALLFELRTQLVVEYYSQRL